MDDLNGTLDRSVFESPAFARFRAEPRGALCAGALDPEVRNWIGAKTAVVRLPDRIMQKQDGRFAQLKGKNLGHRELGTEDYRRLPALLEAPRVVYRPGPPANRPPEAYDNRLCLWGEVDGKFYFAVVERDPATDEVDLISFFRREMTEKQLAKLLGQAREVLRKPRSGGGDCAW